MAVTFIEEKKRQKRLLLIFGFLVAVLVLVLLQGFLRRILPGDIGSEIIAPVFRKADIDFKILENQALKDLDPFEEIKPFEGKIGRNNPFVPY